MNLAAAILLFAWAYARFRALEPGVPESSRAKLLRRGAMVAGAILLGCAFPVSGMLLGVNFAVLALVGLWGAVLMRLRGTQREKLAICAFLALEIVALGAVGVQYRRFLSSEKEFRLGVAQCMRTIEEGRQEELKTRLISLTRTVKPLPEFLAGFRTAAQTSSQTEVQP